MASNHTQKKRRSEFMKRKLGDTIVEYLAHTASILYFIFIFFPMMVFFNLLEWVISFLNRWEI